MPASITFTVLVWKEMVTFTMSYAAFCERVLDIPSSICPEAGSPPWDLFNRVRSLAMVRPFVTDAPLDDQDINRLLRDLCRLANYQRQEEMKMEKEEDEDAQRIANVKKYQEEMNRLKISESSWSEEKFIEWAATNKV